MVIASLLLLCGLASSFMLARYITSKHQCNKERALHFMAMCYTYIEIKLNRLLLVIMDLWFDKQENGMMDKTPQFLASDVTCCHADGSIHVYRPNAPCVEGTVEFKFGPTDDRYSFVSDSGSFLIKDAKVTAQALEALPGVAKLSNPILAAGIVYGEGNDRKNVNLCSLFQRMAGPSCSYAYNREVRLSHLLPMVAVEHAGDFDLIEASGTWFFYSAGGCTSIPACDSSLYSVGNIINTIS